MKSIRLTFILALVLIGFSSCSPWTKVTPDAVFEPRHWHTTTVHDGYMWVIGGREQIIPSRDIWRSRDGVSWTRTTDETPWSVLIGAASVSFRGRMWVLGVDGYPFDVPKKTLEALVWSSEDGKTWVEAAKPPWSGRWQHTATVYDDKIWVIGGSLGGRLNNDVWYSSDGEHWTEAKSSDERMGKGLAQLGARTRHATAVHDGKLWLVGGATGTGWAMSDVWWTRDGAHWTRELEDGPFQNLAEHRLVSFNDHLWIVGGTGINDWPTKRIGRKVWISKDGANWASYGGNAPWTMRLSPGVLAFNDRLWLINGQDSGLGPNGGIWYTEGTDLPTIPEAKPPRARVKRDTHAKKVAGAVTDRDFPEWSGTLGVDWAEVKSPFLSSESDWQEGPAGYGTFVAHDDKLWLFGRAPDTKSAVLSRVFSSTNGAVWKLATDSPGWGERRDMALASHGGRLWMLGGNDWGRSDGNPGEVFNDVWSSEDGEDWELVTDNAPWSQRGEAYAVSFKGRLILLFGYLIDYSTGASFANWSSEVWGSADGIEWEQLTTEVPFLIYSGDTPPVVYDDKIWVIGVRGDGRVVNSWMRGDNRSRIWNSKDGATWNELSTNASWVQRLNPLVIAHEGRLWALYGERNRDPDSHFDTTIKSVSWTTDGVSWTTIPGGRDFHWRFSALLSTGGRMWSIDSYWGTIFISGSGN